MSKLSAFLICAILCTQTGADELDDLRANYTAKLTQIANEAGQKVEQGHQNLDTTVLYFDHTSETFTQQGQDAVNVVLTSLNSTAAELTLNAIINSKPSSVITCISTQHDRAYATVEGRFTTFKDTVDKAAANNNFDALRSSLDIISSQLDAVFQINADKIITCVLVDCFDNNIAAAITQYDNLTKNIAEMTNGLTASRDTFSTAVINALSNLRKNIASDQASGEKNMNNCK